MLILYKLYAFLAKYMDLLGILGISSAYNSVFSSDNRGLGKKLVQYETLRSDYKSYKRLIITYS